MAGWIGVDLDGTLAEHHHETFDINQIGLPLPAMVDRVRAWRKAGHEVRIFTARVGPTFVKPNTVVTGRQGIVDGAPPHDHEFWRAAPCPVCMTVVLAHEEKTFIDAQRALIERWCEIHIGERLPVTATKDFHMWELWDDRAVQVKLNTGQPLVAEPAGEPTP